MPADETVECDEVPDPANVKAVDACDPDVDVVYNEERIDGSCPQSYTLIRTWIAVDDCGNETSGLQEITVEDTEAPVLGTIPANLTLECSDPIPAPPVVSATDNCDNDVQVTLSPQIIPGNCEDSYTMIRTWTATDDCGNTATGSQTISVFDTPHLNSSACRMILRSSVTRSFLYRVYPPSTTVTMMSRSTWKKPDSSRVRSTS
ncbi:MAG: hypothetical protein R2787_04440 [Saprospiraceae bacterium]